MAIIDKIEQRRHSFILSLFFFLLQRLPNKQRRILGIQVTNFNVSRAHQSKLNKPHERITCTNSKQTRTGLRKQVSLETLRRQSKHRKLVGKKIEQKLGRILSLTAGENCTRLSELSSAIDADNDNNNNYGF